ncbi:MAG: hypothetical protein ING00_06045 [Roseomonas sp.]|nr:hypothetical protein [Roseomonas sp.]
MSKALGFLFAGLSFITSLSPATAQTCSGEARGGIGRTSQSGLFLGDGSVAMRAKMNINIDGSGRAYHPRNAEAGALIHLCNAGQIYLPDGSNYHGSESNTVCTGRFMNDFQLIRAAGWTNPSVGAIRWYGILGTGTATIAGRRIDGVIPVELSDGSGFFVSPTSLQRVPRPGEGRLDPRNQDTYVDPLVVPAAVIPTSPLLTQTGVRLGSFGVAVHVQKGIATPFVVGDIGPRVGEGSLALARLVNGLPMPTEITRKQRYEGQVEKPDILWVFFGNNQPTDPYDPNKVFQAARSAFENWGGEDRLRACLANNRIPIN